jgi:hypothetical protein
MADSWKLPLPRPSKVVEDRIVPSMGCLQSTDRLRRVERLDDGVAVVAAVAEVRRWMMLTENAAAVVVVELRPPMRLLLKVRVKTD